jgi:hypothetical protein
MIVVIGSVCFCWESTVVIIHTIEQHTTFQNEEVSKKFWKYNGYFKISVLVVAFIICSSVTVRPGCADYNKHYHLWIYVRFHGLIMCFWCGIGLVLACIMCFC